MDFLFGKRLSRDHVLEFLVFLAEHVQVDGAPDARPLAADHDDRGGIHGEEDPGAATAVRRVTNGFSNSCGEREREVSQSVCRLQLQVPF